MLGCKPAGRLTEQHDIFFGIGNSLKDLLPKMKAFWPEAKGQIHIDAWREVTVVDGYTIEITTEVSNNIAELFFINLGGYKPNEFEEYHYKILAVAETIGIASKKSKETTFYKHCGFKGATSHIDDKFGIDVDDIYKVSEVVTDHNTEKLYLKITKSDVLLPEDDLHIGYTKISSLV